MRQFLVIRTANESRQPFGPKVWNGTRLVDLIGRLEPNVPRSLPSVCGGEVDRCALALAGEEGPGPVEVPRRPSVGRD